jgi:hypothetical protein
MTDVQSEETLDDPPPTAFQPRKRTLLVEQLSVLIPFTFTLLLSHSILSDLFPAKRRFTSL